MLTRLSRFDTHGPLCDQLADWIATDLAGAIRKRGVATLAVSGGSTPKPLFECLSHHSLQMALGLTVNAHTPRMKPGFSPPQVGYSPGGLPGLTFNPDNNIALTFQLGIILLSGLLV